MLDRHGGEVLVSDGTSHLARRLPGLRWIMVTLGFAVAFTIHVLD